MEDACTLFEKVLVPVDGSEHSTRALDAAVQIAKKFKGKVTLLHIYSVDVRPVIMPEPTTALPQGMPMISSAEISKIVENARQVGKGILSDGEQKAKAEGVQFESLLVEGHVVQEIIRTAKEGNFGLIVIGARGRSKIRELLLGSTTDGVIHHVSLPVLVVK